MHKVIMFVCTGDFKEKKHLDDKSAGEEGFNNTQQFDSNNHVSDVK